MQAIEQGSLARNLDVRRRAGVELQQHGHAADLHHRDARCHDWHGLECRHLDTAGGSVEHDFQRLGTVTGHHHTGGVVGMESKDEVVVDRHAGAHDVGRAAQLLGHCPAGASCLVEHHLSVGQSITVAIDNPYVFQVLIVNHCQHDVGVSASSGVVSLRFDTKGEGTVGEATEAVVSVAIGGISGVFVAGDVIPPAVAQVEFRVNEGDGSAIDTSGTIGNRAREVVFAARHGGQYDVVKAAAAADGDRVNGRKVARHLIAEPVVARLEAIEAVPATRVGSGGSDIATGSVESSDRRAHEPAGVGQHKAVNVVLVAARGGSKHQPRQGSGEQHGSG